MDYINKIFNIFDNTEKKKIIILTCLMIFGAILETATTVLILPLMNTLTDESLINDNKIQQLLYNILMCENSADFLIRMLLVLAGIYLFKGGYGIWNTNIQQRFLRNFRTKMSTQLFKTIMNKKYSYHLYNTTADIQRIVVTDVEDFCGLVNALINTLSEVFTMLMIIIVLIVVNPLLTLMAGLVIVTTAFLSNFIVMKRVQHAGKMTRENYKREVGCVQEAIGGIKSIYVNNKQNYFTNKFQRFVYNHANSVKRNTVLASVPRAIVESLSMAGIFFVIVIYIEIGTNSKTLLPLLATFAVAAVRLIPSVNRINNGINSAQYWKASVDAVYKIVNDTEFQDKRYINNNEKEKNNDDVIGDIEVKNVSFKYDDSEKNVISNASFKIPVGKSVAFIGVTGAGKSSLADLILGLHHPNSGTISVGGIDISDNNIWWGTKVGYIPQVIYLLNDTIRKNVAFGIYDDKIDDNRVLQCLYDAQLKDFINELPDGIDTMVGENGIRLSGGQRQRIGIARAIYPDPEFLVLDEATSALDNDTERAIMEAINYLSQNKTLLIIAHRLTTIKDCDIIYKIENEKVVIEKGEDIV